jgi:hypothetical protein
MQNQQHKVGITSIVYDLTKWDYDVRHSGFHSLDLTVKRESEEIADISFSDEEIKVYRKRDLSALEESELDLYLDDLLWQEEFSEFAHLATIQSEYHDAEELIRMIKEKYENELLFIRYNDQDDFMGFLEDVSIQRLDGSDTLTCYFNPVDDDSEIIRTTVALKPDKLAVANAISLKIEGYNETLEITKHVEHHPQ